MSLTQFDTYIKMSLAMDKYDEKVVNNKVFLASAVWTMEVN
jgi:hypothetical protein